MDSGTIIKALSGFYYVDVGEAAPVTCRARGKFRHQKVAPLVGDRVELTRLEDGTGAIDRIIPRRNAFSRPAVANIDQLIIVASAAVPITDPFLIDRMIAIAEARLCQPILCFNKCDLVRADDLADVYRNAGFPVLQTSTKTGEGIESLRKIISGKISAFTGNSGVGKSSILNMLAPEHALPVGDVSEKLGRGRHTTRHVELFRVEDALIADTPGFSSFDVEGVECVSKEELARTFREFTPYLDQCRFAGCAHVKEKGCAVLEALRAGHISPSRHASYVQLYEQAKNRKAWK